MLKKINDRNSDNVKIPGVRAADAEFPAPFRSGLEYSSPARGTWNIVHTGMLIPEAHEIFVCAAGCLRGVVLTAAEMGTSDRFSTVAVRENNLLDGDMEDLVIEGVTDIINKLPKRPPAVLVYTSCVHHFAGVDLDMIYETLRERFPDIDFTDCYMNPIMRKSGLTPDQLMRSRLYMLLHDRQKDPKAVAILGNDIPTRENSDLYRLLKGAGLRIHEITSCKTYEEYQQMAESSVYITYYPDAVPGAEMLADRLGGIHCHLPFSFDSDEIDQGFDRLSDILAAHTAACADSCKDASAAKSQQSASAGMHAEDPQQYTASSEQNLSSILADIRTAGREASAAALRETLELIGETEISIDYTYCPRPFGLARLLLESGFNVRRVYADSIPAADRSDFEFIKQHFSELMLHPTVHTGMRFAQKLNSGSETGKNESVATNAATDAVKTSRTESVAAAVVTDTAKNARIESVAAAVVTDTAKNARIESAAAENDTDAANAAAANNTDAANAVAANNTDTAKNARIESAAAANSTDAANAAAAANSTDAANATADATDATSVASAAGAANRQPHQNVTLAIGQKAAYFDNTDHFINIVEGGGMNGYEAVTETLRLMRDAYLCAKPMRELVQIKGLGCEVCLR